jgi:hypothetical protein
LLSDSELLSADQLLPADELLPAECPAQAADDGAGRAQTASAVEVERQGQELFGKKGRGGGSTVAPTVSSIGAIFTLATAYFSYNRSLGTVPIFVSTKMGLSPFGGHLCSLDHRRSDQIIENTPS